MFNKNKNSSSEEPRKIYYAPTTGEEETEEEREVRIRKQIRREADAFRDAIEKYLTDLYDAHGATVNKGIVSMELAKEFVRRLPSEEVKRLGMALEGMADVTLIY